MKNRGYIFVYGSLKIGGRFSHGFEEKRVSVRPATLKGTLYKWKYAALALAGDRTIHGELHLYKDFSTVVRRMDRIEGFHKRNDENNLYNKNVVEVKTEDGNKTRAITYTLNTHRISVEGCEIIEDGVWQN